MKIFWILLYTIGGWQPISDIGGKWLPVDYETIDKKNQKLEFMDNWKDYYFTINTYSIFFSTTDLNDRLKTLSKSERESARIFKGVEYEFLENYTIKLSTK